MPFVTEELWQRLKLQGAAESGQPVSISLAHYPKPEPASADDHSRAFELLRSIVTAARELRADNKLDAKQVYPAAVRWNDARIPAEDLEIAGRLTRLAVTESANALPGGGLLRSSPEFDLRIEAQAPATNGAGSAETRVRLEKRKPRIERLIDSHKRQLGDQQFLSKAPAKLIETMKAKLADYEAQLSKNEDQLARPGIEVRMFDTTHPDVRGAVERALAEDLGPGDVTTTLTVPENLGAHGFFLAKQDFVAAGLELLPLIYQLGGGADVKLLTSKWRQHFKRHASCRSARFGACSSEL